MIRRRSSRALGAVASALVALFASAATADIYTWTDERGTTVISDKPPANPKSVTDLEGVVALEKGLLRNRIIAGTLDPTFAGPGSITRIHVR